MVQGYYTLEESAQILGMSADELKQLARKGEIRSFQDRGTWRFRIQDIQEMARRRGHGSDPELALGEALKPKPTDSPAPRSPKPQKKSDDVFGFSLDTEMDAEGSVDLGADADRQLDPRGSKPGSGRAPASKPPSSKKTGSKDKLVQPGSDSDVRLVGDGSDVTFKAPVDSDVKVVEEKGPKSGPRSGTAPVGPKSPRPAKQPLAEPPAPAGSDSGVRLVPIDSDSDVRIVGAGSDEYDAAVGATPAKASTDSDIRLEGHVPPPPRSGAEGILTEEINLDEELKKDEAQRQAQMQQAKLRPKEPQFPKTSPFELSEADLDLPAAEQPPLPQVKEEDSSDFELTPAKEQEQDRSSDFDLTPASESSSPLEPTTSDEFRLEVPDEDDEITLADEGSPELKGPSSGINLNKPADSGISLEQTGEGSDEIEFSLTLDAEATPKPDPAKAGLVPATDDSDSEFELSLDLEHQQKSDSDSEFELTLDDTGGLEPLEDTPKPKPKKGAEKDIFETDFEVPGLEEDSGSDAMAVEEADTELESSDFELAIGEADVEAEVDESGSMVVPLDEDEEVAVDDAAETVTAKSRQKKKPQAKVEKPVKKTKARPPSGEVEVEAEAELDTEDMGFEDLAEPLAEAEVEEPEAELDEEEPLAEEEPGKPRVIRETVVLQQAPWGIFPTVVLLPCVVVMVLLGIMGVELIQQQQQGSYKPGVLTKAIAGIIGADKK
jgi:hypothetical protein